MGDEIIDAIDEGRFAAANREIASKLKRFPDKSYYVALNCYYLCAVGKLQEAEEACKALKQKVPSDSQALAVLSTVYAKLGKSNEANEVYENAIKKYPSTDLILTWFNRAVEKYDTRLIQKSAMQLQKHAKSTRQYGIRAAFACYMWGRKTESEKEQTLYLGLAQGLIEKMLPLESDQEIYVHAVILERLGEFEKLIALLEPMKHRELELILIYLRVLDVTEKWDALYLESHRLLFEANFNDFDTWKYLIKASKKLDKPTGNLSSLIKFDTRNSYVASIEMCKIYESGLIEAIDNYYEKFQSKPCCVPDLSMYELSESFYDKIQKQTIQLLKQTTLTTHEAVTLYNIQRFLLIRDPSYEVPMVQIEKYDNPELSDMYLVTMVASLKENNAPEDIIKHIITLEHFSKKDPENYKIKSWLLNLYGLINAPSLALQVYKDLKIKMIQHDTLSYKLTLEPTVGNLNEFIQIFRFYLTSDSELSAYVNNAFKDDLYTKLDDFLRFGERLSRSLSRHLLTVSILKCARMLNNDYYNYFYKELKSTKAEILSEDFTLHDNRDFSSDYNFGVNSESLQIYEDNKKRGTNYVKLFYLKELLIVEKDGAEITKYLKLFNKYLSNVKYTLQLSTFEAHMFKLYLSFFQLVKVAKPKDRNLLVNYLIKNLDFSKFEQTFISKLPPLSGTLNVILVDILEFVKVAQAILREPQLTETIKKLHADLAEYNASSGQINHLKEIKKNLKFNNIDDAFIDDQFEALEDGLKRSIVKIR